MVTSNCLSPLQKLYDMPTVHAAIYLVPQITAESSRRQHLAAKGYRGTALKSGWDDRLWSPIERYSWSAKARAVQSQGCRDMGALSNGHYVLRHAIALNHIHTHPGMTSW